MAIKNKIISNPVTGQSIQFIKTSKDTNGKLLEMQTTYNAHSKEPASHYHPYQSEEFTILSGEITVRLNGKLKTFRKGDTLHVPANTVHAMWNTTDQPASVNWKVSPAMESEFLLENTFGLSAEGKVNKQGMPPLLQVALSINKYNKVFRLATPSFVVQKIIFSILSPFAYLLGYRASYKKYID